MLILLSLCLVSLFREFDSRITPQCQCGYGGFCAGPYAEYFAHIPCRELCRNFSAGFYNLDCQTIVDHCSSSPCVRGTCRQTFGSYFCQCPPDYFGQNCDVLSKKLTAMGVKSELFIHYQIHPVVHSARSFTVIYDPLERNTDDNSYVQLVVNISDGRSYYPNRREHFIKTDIKSECIRNAKEAPDIQDKKVCNYIPEGDVWSFSFDPTYFGHLAATSMALNVDGLGLVGRFGTVTVYVFVMSKKKTKSSALMTLYNQTYNIFTYHVLRNMHNCFMQILLAPCSHDARYPTVYSRGSQIEIKVSKYVKNCPGALQVKYDWYLQKHTDSPGLHPNKDGMPVLLVFDDDRRGVKFRQRYFDEGIHMIEYILTLRGNPPHFGGIMEFRQMARCWFRVIAQDPVIKVKGGEIRAVSCFGPMSLELMNMNADIDVNTITFESSCNVTNDHECDKKILEAPLVTKLSTVCDTHYKFKIAMPDFKLAPLFIIVHFVRSSASLSINCLINCYPIDVHERVVITAKTTPYVPSYAHWVITVDNKSITKRDGFFGFAFNPPAATRIIRINGERFINSVNDSYANVQFEAHGINGLHAKMSTKANNLDSSLNDFEVQPYDGIPGVYKIVRIAYRAPAHPPITYRVYQTRGDGLNADIAILETHYEEQIIFAAFWPLSQICLEDSTGAVACAYLDINGTSEPSSFFQTTFDGLKSVFDAGDHEAFMSQAYGFILSGLNITQMGEHHSASWKLTAMERLGVLELVAKLPPFQRQTYIVYGLQIVFLLAFSRVGNKLQELIDFAEEEVQADDNIIESLTVWYRLRHTNLVLFCNLLDNLITETVENPNSRYWPFQFGDMSDILSDILSLIYVQRHVSFDFHNDSKTAALQRADYDFWVWKNDQLYQRAMGKYADFLSRTSRLFYGINTYGRHQGRVWSVRTTYRGILDAFSRRGRKYSETTHNTANHIFGTKPKPTNTTTAPPNKKAEDEWLNYVKIEFPPSTQEWEHKELRLIPAKSLDGWLDLPYRLVPQSTAVVLRGVMGIICFMIKQRFSGVVDFLQFVNVVLRIPALTLTDRSFQVMAFKSRIDSKQISPYMFLEMRDKTGEQITELPDSKPFNMTLPLMKDGILLNSSYPHEYYREEMLRQHEGKLVKEKRECVAYKISLPSEYNEWDVVIGTTERVPMKADVSYTVPDFNKVMKWKMLKMTYSNERKMFYSLVKVNPPEGKHVIRYFYLGISTSFQNTTANHLTISLRSSTDVCFIFELLKPTVMTCKGFSDNFGLPLIKCNCKTLGLFAAVGLPISINKLLISNIPFIMPKVLSYENIIIVVILGLFVISILIVAFIKDRASLQKTTLIYLEDNYPNDGYIMVVGVYTGLLYQAGTSSCVALKLVGERSSSRVHVLKAYDRKTLRTGNDDWFVIAMSDSPGRITDIYIWQDYRDLSGWYCDRIVVIDLNENRYYFAHEKRRLVVSIYEETPRLEALEVKLTETTSEGNICMTHTLMDNFAREVRNTHHVFSLCLMHTRYLSTYEQKSIILLVKILSICVWIWALQEPIHFWIYGKHLDSISANSLVGLNSLPFCWALCAALLSHPCTFIFDLLYRRSHWSRILQKKTTNPLNLEANQTLSLRTTSKGLPAESPRSRGSSYYNYKRSMLSSMPSKYSTTLLVQEDRKNYVRLAFWPSQFRCVDIDRDAIALKTQITTLFMRGGACVTLAALFGTIIYLEFFTGFARKTPLSAYVLAWAIVFDVVILNPLIVFITSSFAFLAFQMSNKEKIFLSEEMRVHQPLRISYADYLTKATKKEYKPLLTTEIEALRRKKLIYKFLLKLIFHLLALLGMVCSYTILSVNYDMVHFNVKRVIRYSALEPHDSKSPSARSVHDITAAANYVSRTLSSCSGFWYNLKPNHRSRSRTLVVPIEFAEYFAEAKGFYSESKPKTDPLELGDVILHYTKISNGYIYGKSMERYPLTGHLRAIPLNPWTQYSSQMKILMDDMLEADKYDDIRALFLTTNYIFPDALYLVTVDCLIEFLPSGISVTFSRVRGIVTDVRNTSLHIYRKIIVVLFACFAICTIASVSRMGIKSYFKDRNNGSKLFILVASCVVVISTLMRPTYRASAIDELMQGLMTEYIDVHGVYTFEFFDSSALLLYFSSLLLNLMLILRKVSISEWLNHTCARTIRIALLAVILQLYFITLFQKCLRMFESGFGWVLIFTYMNEPPRRLPHFGKLEDTFGAIFSVFLVICAKGVAAMIVGRALQSTGRCTVPVAAYIDTLKPGAHKWRKSFVMETVRKSVTSVKANTRMSRDSRHSRKQSAMIQRASKVERKQFWIS